MRTGTARWATWIALLAGAGCTSTVYQNAPSGGATATGAPGPGGAAPSTSTSTAGAGQGGVGPSAQSSATSSGQGGGASSSGQGGATSSSGSSASSSGTTGATSSTGTSASSSGQGGATSSSGAASSTGSSTSSSGQGGGTTTGSSSSGAGGGPLCKPAPLIGLDLSVSPAMSARLDPTTGVITDLAPIVGMGGVADGFAAYDPLTKRLYELGQSVYTIDAVTGVLLHVAALSTNNAYNPVVTSAGELFVLDLDTHETATVDPMTGVVTDLAPYASVAGIAQAFRGYDPLTNRVYQLGASVYAFDGTSGELLFSSVEAVQHGGLYNPGVNGTGQILGIALDGSATQVARLDPMTGAATDLALVSASGALAQGMYAVDPCANLMYQVGNESVLTIDGATGAVISVVPVSKQNFLNFVAAW